jgi:dihydropteroate synthase
MIADQPRTLDDLDDLVADEEARLWLRPLALMTGAPAAAIARGEAMPMSGGAFTWLEVLARRAGGVVAATAPLARLRRWSAARGPTAARRIEQQLAHLTGTRPAWAGLTLDRPLVMGIVNVTPDSFSDGGRFLDPARAIAHGRALMEAGADILDIGGESTRPGAASVPPEEERRRVEPVIRDLAAAGAVISVDTRHAAVMAAALAAGARIVNDVTALTGDPGSLDVIAGSDAAVVLMHMQGEPGTMQRDPHYTLASLDVVEYLEGRITACEAAGIPRQRIVVDPGIGFGKRQRHNLEILSRLALFQALGCGLLLGVSRKSFVAELAGGVAPEARVPGSLAGALHGVAQGAQILRVHDVDATRQALTLWQRIAGGS